MMDAVRFQWPARAWENTTAVATPASTNPEQGRITNNGLRRKHNETEDTHTRTQTTKRRKPPAIRRGATSPPPPRTRPAPKKGRSKVDRREKLGQNTARRNAAIAHHKWEEKKNAAPPWVTSLSGPSPQPETLPLRGRAARTMERYYPTKTKKCSRNLPPPPYQINILNIVTNILPEVHRELSAHYHWMQRDVAGTLPKNIETYLCNHPDYANWTEPNLTKESHRLVSEHLQTFAQHATPRLESIKISIPGELASPATLTSTAIALVAMRSHIAPDASEEAKKAKIVEVQRLGISNHRAHVKAYMHLWSARVAALRGTMRQVEKENAARS